MPRPLHPVVRVGLYLASLGVGMVLASVVAAPLVAALGGAIPPPMGVDVGGEVLDGAALALQLVGMVAAIGITCLFWQVVDGRSMVSIGLGAGGCARQLAGGFALGLGLMAVVFAAELLLGGYRVRGLGSLTLGASGLVIGAGGMFVGFVLVSVEEELIARGYLLQNLRDAWGTAAAVLLSSVLFAVAHLGNPGAGLSSSIGIFAAGLQLACAYLVSGRLWLPIGLHLSWNFFQGTVFGFPVSGIRTPSLLLLEPVGPGYLTGGEFGPEASLVGVSANLLGIAVLLIWRRR